MSQPNELLNFLGFRSLDASNLSFFQNVKKEAGGHEMKVLPIINEVDMTTTHATFQKHFKFSIKASVAPRDEKKTYVVLIACLISFCDIPSEFFEGGGVIPKCGLTAFPNTPHEASIRLWCSKQVGKNVIYELTVSSYKDAVPEPLEDKPSLWKKVVLKED